MQEREEKMKYDIEELLGQGRTVQIEPQGYSMYPLFVPGRDKAVVAPIGDMKKLRRGDVVLYRRDESILVLHRIWKRRTEGFYLVGDNQREIEGPLRPDQMKGILVEIVQKGRRFSVKNPVYWVLFRIWLILRPFRPVISKAVAKGKRSMKKN